MSVPLSTGLKSYCEIGFGFVNIHSVTDSVVFRSKEQTISYDMSTPDTRTVVRHSLIDADLASDRNLVDVQKQLLAFPMDLNINFWRLAKGIRDVLLSSVLRRGAEKTQ